MKEQKSAKRADTLNALHQETEEKIRNNFARTVRFKDIKMNYPKSEPPCDIYTT